MTDAGRPALSLRYKLPLVISALLCVVVATLTWLSYRQLEHVLIDANSARLTSVSQNLGSMLGESGRRIVAEERLGATDSALAHFLEHSNDTAARLGALKSLERIRARFPLQVVSISVTSADRQHQLTLGQQPVATRNDSNSGTVIDVAAPLPDSTSLSPVIRSDSGMVFRAQAAILSPTLDTIGYLMTYRRIGTGAAADQITKLFGSDASLLLGNSSGSLWTDVVHAVPGPPAAFKTGAVGSYVAKEGGTKMLALANDVAGTPWTTLIQLPWNSALAPARSFLVATAGLALLLLVLGAGVAWFISRQLTKPLADVSRAAQDLALGDYGRRVVVHRRDEIGSLASSFNSMATQVESSRHELQVNAKALKSANADLRDSEHRYRQLVELLPDAVVVHRDGNIVLANPAAVSLFGETNSSDVMNESLGKYVPQHAPELQLGSTIATDAARLAVALRQRSVRSRDGSSVNAEATIVPFTHDGQPAELMILRDISEREQLESRFRQAQKMEAVGQLAGGVAHDFNNLLTVVTSYSAMLLADLPHDSAVRVDIQEIANAADRAAALTRQLLAFSRQQVLEVRVLDLNQIVRDMEKMLRRIIPANIRLATKLAPSLGRICADPGQLEQVLMNLAVNARDAMPSGGTLLLETAEIEVSESDAPMHSGATPGSYVLLIVSDTGCGMTPVQQARIFDPFFTTKPAGEGTGLGLSTVYGIVKQSGGFIWVYSEVDQGTVFRIYLPKVDAKLDAVKAASAILDASRKSGGETVLLVEDEPSVRKTARRILEGAGYQVVEATNGREALELCAHMAGRIDLLLTDMVMPEMSGRELAERFGVLMPSAPVIFMSGYTEDTVLRQSAVGPVTFFLQKPFTPQTLTAKVRTTLEAVAATRNP